MSDFAKAKIIFALAIVGVLFAMHPLIDRHGSEGLEFFGVLLQFQAIYYTFLGLLGCSVYFYAVDFVTDNPLGFSHRIGNHFYAIAMLFPPVFALAWMAGTIGQGIVWISDSPAAGEVSKIAVAILSGASGLLIAHLVSRRMNLRDRFANLDQLSIRAKSHLQRAEEMQNAGHHDLVALEAFRAIESALQRALLDGDVHVPSSRPNQLIPIAARAGVIPGSVVGVFHELRIARNRAVHAADEFDEKDASWFIDTTRKMLTSIRAAKVSEEDDGERAEAA